MLVLPFALSLALPVQQPAGTGELASAERELAAIERAVLDYAEAYYEVRPDYVERGIHPGLVKVGLLDDDEGRPTTKPMDYAGFAAMVQWFVDNERVPEPGPKEVVVLDALDQTALCKLTGSWGVDYMQLAKFDGRWQTRHVVWQREPSARDAADVEADRRAIEAAALDYVEGVYDVQPERIERSVAPGLAKLGFWRNAPDQPYAEYAMTYDELVALAGRWNEDGSHAGPDSPKRVEVLDLLDRVACVKVTAEWGVDYMHLTKEDGRWRIVHVLWQTAPFDAPARSG